MWSVLSSFQFFEDGGTRPLAVSGANASSLILHSLRKNVEFKCIITSRRQDIFITVVKRMIPDIWSHA